MAKRVFEQMDGTGRAAADIVAEQGLAQVSDDGVLAGVVAGVVGAHADAVQQYRNGKKAAFGFLVGEAMKASRRQRRSAPPQPAAARTLDG